MRIAIEATLLAASLFTLLGQASAQSPTQTEPQGSSSAASVADEIKALELKSDKLIVTADWDEYEKLLTFDFTRILYDGKLENKKETMASFRGGPRKLIVIEPDDLQVRTYGEIAVLQGRSTIWVRESGHLNTKIERYTELFVKQDGQWKLAVQQQTTVGK